MADFGSRLKHLRRTAKLSQEEASKVLDLTRSTLSGYENGTAEPSIPTLRKMSQYFGVSLDYLLGVSDEADSSNPDTQGRFLRVLATTVDSNDVENIELVPEKAKAGYRTGFADPEFIKVLPAFQLPFLSKEKKYRTFEISGDSMPPVEEGAFVTAEYIENWNNIKDGFPYIVVTRDEGVVFKVVYNQISSSQSLLLCSTNPLYKPYSVKVKDVVEVWKFVNFMSGKAPSLEAEEAGSSASFSQVLSQIQKEVEQLKIKMGD